MGAKKKAFTAEQLKKMANRILKAEKIEKDWEKVKRQAMKRTTAKPVS